MTDETPATGPAPDPLTTMPEAGAAENATATATAPAEEAAPAEGGEEKKDKLQQTVEIKDVGPCRKHIKVTIDRANIDELLEAKFKELVQDAAVPGFRPGKAPRKVITRRFHREVSDQVKGQLLLASLEQLAEEHDVVPLTAPDIDPLKLELPEKGPFIYEFEVEVRPQFDLPDYKGMKLKRPVRAFTDKEVDREQRRILSRWGQLVPKEPGEAAEEGDYLIADMTSKFADVVIGSAREVTLAVEPRLAFRDGVAEKFGEQVKGAKAGETRVVEIQMSDAVALEQLRGKTLQATLEIKDVKKMRLPELTHEFLHNLGCHTPEQLRERIHLLLEKRLEYEQRQAAREQVLGQIAAASTWDLPRDFLMRHARKALARKVMEMREAGIPEDEIRARQRLLEQDVLKHTTLSLKEHFVLQKIAEVEKLELSEDEVAGEIDHIAEQSGESPRRVRAQIEKEDLMETLQAQIIERKALDLILETAEYEDVSIGEAPPSVGTVEEQAVPGEMKDPTAPLPEAAEGGPAAEGEKGA